MASKLINITAVTTVLSQPSPTYALVVDSTSGIVVNDYISDNEGGVYHITIISDATNLTAIDDTDITPEGVPVIGVGSCFTPTNALKLSQAPFNTPGWGEIARRDMRAIDAGANSSTRSATSASITYYVDPAGSDVTGSGSITLPFRSIQYALDSIPKRVRHIVNIKVSAGTYNGFTLNGFVFDPIIPGSATGISILGTWVNFAPATGAATGTLSSVAAGTSNPVTWAVLTDAGQTWTTDNLKGKFINILTGTSAGTILPIASNTATNLAVISSSALGSIGGTYAIIDSASIVNTPVEVPNSLPAVQGTPTIAAAHATINVYGNIGSAVNNSLIRFEALKTAAAAFYGFFTEGNQAITIARCQITGAVTGSGLSMLGPGRTTLTQSIVNLTTGSGTSIAAAAGATQTSVISTLTTCTTGGIGNNAITVGSISGPFSSTTLVQVQIDSHLVGILSAGNVAISLSSVRISGAGGQLIKADPAHNAQAQTIIVVASGLDLSNSGASTAVQLGGPQAFLTCVVSASTGTITGSGNSIAFAVEQGARVQVSAASTITGTTEILLDSMPHTLAEMRAQSPKVLNNLSYFSCVFE